MAKRSTGRPPARLQASDPEVLVELALAGAGVLQVALHHVVATLRAGHLKLLQCRIHDADEREIVLPVDAPAAGRA